MNELILSVQPDKFLFDYKILLFALVILIVSIILACKKKSWQKAMITLGASDVVATIAYVYNRIYDTSQGQGYRYFLETNKSLDELASFVIKILIYFCVVFLGEKVIDRFRGGK